jgi:hypothetical protein
MAAWIWTRILNADPDPVGLKSAKKRKKKAYKRQIIRHKKDKKQCNWYKWVNVTLFSLKVNL